MRLLSSTYSILSYIALAQCADNASKPLTSKLLLPSQFQPPAVFKNANLVHIVNLEKSYPKESINVVIENVSKEPQNEYYVPFTSGQMEKVGGFEVKDRKDADAGPFKVEAAEFDQESDTQFYRITLPRPLATGEQQTIGMSFFYLSSLSPSPARIAQADSQHLVYTLSAYCASAYHTVKQKTELKFPSASVSAATKLPGMNGEPESPQKSGSKYTYGPYSAIPAGSYEPIEVRYEYTHPIPHVSRIERDIEVSHWGGNVAFEERYTLTNLAAPLAKQFNRVEWATAAHYNAPTTAIRSLSFSLQPGSQDAYYTDVVGNVSTSRWRSGKKEAHLEVKPRYPIFGDWNFPFRIGWNADLSSYLRHVPSTSSYILRVPFLEGPKIAEGVSYAIFETRIILPEGARILEWSSEADVDEADAQIGTHATFMDTIGRTSLVFTKRGVNDEWAGRHVLVRYELDLISRLRKPLVVGTAMLLAFAGAWTLGCIDIGIGSARMKAS